MTAKADTTPRVRGKRGFGTAGVMEAGYNPACAGKTAERGRGLLPLRIQPRVCGENTSSASRSILRHDTTPRVRGKQCVLHHETCVARYNPACAGKTARRCITASIRTIQPRVCGENRIQRMPSGILPDTTPRVRGKQQNEQEQFVPARYNPACAGKTNQHRSNHWFA